MRALIIDDEPLARRGVALRLREHPDVEIIGECEDGFSAVTQITELRPDVVFLDIQMPGMDGFDVLRALPRDSIPGVIFITAYEQHALRAFEEHAMDYLLKPLDDRRFALAVDRARKMVASTAKARMAERVLKLLDAEGERYVSRFAVKTGSRIQIVLVEDLVWIGAAGDYIELHSGGRSHLLRQTMSTVEQELDPSLFIRIHRSRIVRSSEIVELVSIENREYVVKLTDGSEHRSSRTYADRLEAWIGTRKS